MPLCLIGLGRMGANGTARLIEAGRAVVVRDSHARSVGRPCERMVGDPLEMILCEQVAPQTPACLGLFGDAMRRDGEAFGRESATWAPERADEVIGSDGPWRNPETA